MIAMMSNEWWWFSTGWTTKCIRSKSRKNARAKCTDSRRETSTSEPAMHNSIHVRIAYRSTGIWTSQFTSLFSSVILPKVNVVGRLSRDCRNRYDFSRWRNCQGVSCEAMELASWGHMAEWLGRRSLAGRLSLTCARSIVGRWPLCW